MDIYELLQELIEVKKYRSLFTLFINDRKEELDTDVDRKIFDILKNISSLIMKISGEEVKFVPCYVLDGERSFAVHDLTEEDYKLLSNLDLSKLPLNLQARVADVLWLQNRDYKSATIAHKAYYDLFNLWFSDDKYIESLDMIKRAIGIAAQINDKNSLNDYCQKVFDHIIRIDGKDNNFLSISLIEIIINRSFGDLIKLVDILNNSISLSGDNPNKIERLYLLKVKCLNKLKDKEAAMKINVELAEYFLEFAEKVLAHEEKGAMRAEHFFRKSIMLFRNNGETVKAEETHKRLMEVQRQIPNLMAIHSIPFDARKIIENINQNMVGLNFEECIIRITQMFSFYKKEDFKKKVLKTLETSPFSHMFVKNTINDAGQTVFVLPPLNTLEPETDEVILDMHIQNTMLEHERITGTMFLNFAMRYIKENFDVENESADFLVNDSIIVPDDRKNIISKALHQAFCGEYYESLHILAPQIENVFRNIAREVGGLTVTLETDGSSKEKLLSSIFDLSELKECYDNDILFLFKGLLNEQAGANIRNDIAHGIMSRQRSFSGECIFFVCAVVKLLVISSPYCLEILSDEKLKSFKNLSKDIVYSDVIDIK